MTGDQNPLDSTQNLSPRVDIEFVLRAAGLGIWEYDPATGQTHWDERCRALYGLHEENTMSYEQAFRYVHPDDAALVKKAVARVLTPTSDGLFDVTFRIIGGDDGRLRRVRFQGQAHVTATGEVQRFGGIAQEVTPLKPDQQQVVSQPDQVNSIVRQTPAPTLVLRGDDYRIEEINAPMLAFMDRDKNIIGQPLLVVMPELTGQFAWQQVQQVYLEGVDFDQAEVLVSHTRDGILQDIYYNVSYRPLRERGQIMGIIQVAIDVTDQVKDRQKAASLETKLLGLITAAPVAIALLVGRDLIIESPNQTFIDIVGKGPDIEGLPLRQAMPELTIAGQKVLSVLDDVFTTGILFVSPASPIRVLQDGVLAERYYNISYAPIYNTAGDVYAISNIAIDVTAQVLAQQALAEREAILREAIELAELGTWYVDERSGQVTYSARTHEWMGLGLQTSIEHAFDAVSPAESDRVEAAYQQAIRSQSTGRMDAEFLVANVHTGRQRLLRIVGQTQRDDQGQLLSTSGFAQDVTQLRASQQALELLVSERTGQLAVSNEELAASNEELAASNEELESNNEEYAAINEELEEANSLLTRSNDNLQTFAYVASHDLQEPLRKIQQFGDLLKTRFADSVNGEELAYLERMQSAASRMSTLIKELLGYSRIATRRNSAEPVSLDQIVSDVLSVLDMTIEEAKAQVQVDTLPTILGDAAQMGQLFQNLISNALKFHKPGVAPLIHISCRTIAADELPPTVKPTQRAGFYHQISVRDNGIGFDEKYLDRIFQVFQRLHGKSQYVGTGIGLAICEKVAANHGGVITASSQLGEGATFIIYLPA